MMDDWLVDSWLMMNALLFNADSRLVKDTRLVVNHGVVQNRLVVPDWLMPDRFKIPDWLVPDRLKKPHWLMPNWLVMLKRFVPDRVVDVVFNVHFLLMTWHMRNGRNVWNVNGFLLADYRYFWYARFVLVVRSLQVDVMF